MCKTVCLLALTTTFGLTAITYAQDRTTPADNTKVNSRDRAKSAVTADQQKENTTDLLHTFTKHIACQIASSLKGLSGQILMTGGGVFNVTTTLLVAVQPLVGDVTVTL